MTNTIIKLLLKNKIKVKSYQNNDDFVNVFTIYDNNKNNSLILSLINTLELELLIFYKNGTYEHIPLNYNIYIKRSFDNIKSQVELFKFIKTKINSLQTYNFIVHNPESIFKLKNLLNIDYIAPLYKVNISAEQLNKLIDNLINIYDNDKY
jgi:hypothetical protein